MQVLKAIVAVLINAPLATLAVEDGGSTLFRLATREDTKDARMNIHIPKDTRYSTGAGGQKQEIEGVSIAQVFFPESNLKEAKDAGRKFQASPFTWEIFISGTKELLWTMECTANVKPEWTGTTEFKLTLNNTDGPWVYQENQFKLEPETSHVECPKGECVFDKGCKGYEKPKWDFTLD
ncbi:hypothetical protein I316_03635 [Kwoniella heveanensis BCC8398]|uniref:Uncharacterized protein n=1 Tax=Kwoniella heveanensis BCC8398 TaxID=1296120 RepID=A0A1B9GU70_9TREE|nr:hypothetical protein I316_03635 [Kwoniella heveanensis BCC8398]